MIFTCPICKNECSCTREDEPRFKAQKLECDICYSAIVKKRYRPINKHGGVTIFSPINSALGDAVVERVVRERYKRDNPDERIVDIALCDADEAVRVYKPDKFFWASTTQFMNRPKTFKVVNYSVPVEATWLAKEGFYPDWPHGKEDFVDVGTGRFAVLNFRNIVKCTWKNAEPFLVNVVLIELNKYVESGIIDKAVLVGNDVRDSAVYWPEWIDDRYRQLSTEQIAGLCARSKIFIGKDCGIAHLAAAAGARNMIVWGYTEKQWIVKTHPGRFTALMKQNSTVSSLRAAIKDRMEKIDDLFKMDAIQQTVALGVAQQRAGNY